MKRIVRRLLAFLALLLPATGWAHAVNHAFYPLGPMPVWLAAEWWLFALLPLPVIAVEMLVLWWQAPQEGALGNAWRAAVLFLATQVWQTLVMNVLTALPFFRYAGWRSSIDDTIALAVFVLAGVAIAIPVGLLLYRRAGLRPQRVIVSACMASFAGYLAALGFCMLLVKIRGF